ncbi:MAG TPA: methyltransferase domain-containing protein [Lysobacter sp.]
MKLNVERVMAEVRDEVFRRGGSFGSGESELMIDAEGALPFWRCAAGQVPIKPAYSLSELLRYADRGFVESAYLAVLRRMPDPGGLALYVGLLRGGQLSKVEVLGALRWSPEGISRGTHVDGLLLPYTLQKWSRKRYLGPVLRWVTGVLRLSDFLDRAKQIEASQAAEIQDLGRLVNVLSRQVQSRLVRIEEKSHDLTEESRLTSEEVAHQLAQLHASVDRLGGLVDSEIAQLRKELAQLIRQVGLSPNHDLDPLYVAFEEEFRGSSDLIRTRALPYIDIVRSAGAGTAEAPVIDIGCGRGDWLNTLREHGLIARGVDSNRMFLGMCAARGLDVIEGDVIEVLGAMPDASAGAITGIHIVEHLPFEVMIRLLDECRRVLRPGGVLALETPNPENLSVGSHLFYMDPTHRNPLPPLALRWLVEARGFDDARIERWTQARDMGAPPLLAPEIPGAPSVNVLLGQLHAAPDYAIVARRPS